MITDNLLEEKLILPFTTPTLLCVTSAPQLGFGEVIEGFTLTLSPTLMSTGAFIVDKFETSKILQ